MLSKPEDKKRKPKAAAARQTQQTTAVTVARMATVSTFAVCLLPFFLKLDIAGMWNDVAGLPLAAVSSWLTTTNARVQQKAAICLKW